MFSRLEVDFFPLTTVDKWEVSFTKRRECTKDDQSSERSAATREKTPKNLDRVHRMLIDDRRFTMNKLANVIKISHERIENILQNERGMRWGGCHVC